MEDEIVIVIKTCGDCGWAVRASGGRKPVCGNPRIQAERPYADALGCKDRKITFDSIPDWCPLRKEK